MRKHIEVGTKFGRLTVVENVEEYRHTKARCRCDCGGEVLVRNSVLRASESNSCGCLNMDKRRGRAKHGAAKNGAQTPEYRAWRAIKDRCYRQRYPNYARYGGRGITVCDRWLNSFDDFLADMGPRPSWATSIDRIDNNGNYEPGNCRWANAEIQSNNKSDVKLIEFAGERMSVPQWARRVGLEEATLRRRINHGWSLERALHQPVTASRE